MIKQKIKRNTVHGVDVVIVDCDKTMDLNVSIVYPLPICIAKKYSGVPHIFEHLVFGDVVDGFRTGSDLIMEANKYNIDLFASTSKTSIIFTMSMKSFVLPKDAPGYSSIKRFDITDQSYEFLKKLIAGFMKQHAFTEEAVEKEIGVVLSEIEHDSGKTEQIYNVLLTNVSGTHILGDKRDIEVLNRHIINDFAMRLPLPKIAIQTDSNKEYFCEIEDDIEDIIKSLRKVMPSQGSIQEMSTPKLKSVNPRIYDGITDIREISRKLNSLAVIYPRTSSTSARDIENEHMRYAAISVILDPFFKNSLGNLLREQLGVIYGFTNAGIIKGEYNANLSAYFTSIEDKIDMSNDNFLGSLLRKIDQCLCNMPCPSETEYAAIMSEHIVPLFRKANYTGTSLESAIHLTLVPISKHVTDRILEMPFDFSYEQFTEMFDEVKNSISIAIL